MRARALLDEAGCLRKEHGMFEREIQEASWFASTFLDYSILFLVFFGDRTAQYSFVMI